MNENSELRITVCTKKFQLLLAIAIIVGTIGWGMAVKHLHEWLPSIFEQATKFPFVDSFVMVASIAAQYLMAKKKLENWFLWVVIDIVAVFLYGFAGYTFTALLYLVLVGIASKGLYDWYRTYKSYQVR